MKSVTSTEANRSFSRLLRTAVQGESVVITSRGRSVAVLSPAEVGKDARADARRAAARAQLVGRLAAQPIVGSRDWSRDDLYDDPTHAHP